MSTLSPFDAARRKGHIAYVRGESEADCPYADRRTERGAVTFSRAWRRAWLEGWREARERHRAGLPPLHE